MLEKDDWLKLSELYAPTLRRQNSNILKYFDRDGGFIAHDILNEKFLILFALSLDAVQFSST